VAVVTPTHDVRPAVVWLTGLSGSGKTTLATWAAERLRAHGARVELLDGDALRSVFPTTGFSRAERDAHVRRAGFLASRLEHHGVFVIAALVSPYRDSRAFVRQLCGTFIEVYVSTPLAACEARDVKGLYAKARAGEVEAFTGVSDPYEPPLTPDLAIDTSTMSIEEAGERLLAHILTTVNG